MMKKEMIVGSVVVNALGEKSTVVDYVAGNEFSSAYIVLDNGKKMGVKITFEKSILKYEDAVADAIKAAIEEEEKLKKEAYEKKALAAVAAAEAKVLAVSASASAVKVAAPAVNAVNTVNTVVDEDAITLFRGENDYLSNMYECSVEYNGLTYGNSEAAFQAQKEVARANEFTAIAGKSAKMLGKKVHMRADWNVVRVGIMREVVRAKFSQNEELKEKLLATGNKQLVEGNTWNDTFWGVCRGKGQNMLGKILMEIRDELSR